MELEPWFLPRFPANFFPTGFFLAGFFLASVQTAFDLLAVAQLYYFFKDFVPFLLAFCTLGLYCILLIPSLTGSLTNAKLGNLYGDIGQDGLFILWFNVMSELMFPSLTGSLTGIKLESLYGDVG